jgi:hypothetical protein
VLLKPETDTLHFQLLEEKGISHKTAVSVDYLTPGHGVELKKLLDEYSDVLRERLVLTHSIKYHNQLKDSTRLSPLHIGWLIRR